MAFKLLVLTSLLCSSCFGIRMLPIQDFPLVSYLCWNQGSERYEYILFETCHQFSPLPRSLYCWDDVTGNFRLPSANVCPVTTDELATRNFGALARSMEYKSIPYRTSSKVSEQNVDVSMPMVVPLNGKDSKSLETPRSDQYTIPLVVSLNTNNVKQDPNDNSISASTNEFRYPYQRWITPENKETSNNNDDDDDTRFQEPLLYQFTNYRRYPIVRYHGQVISANVKGDSYELPYEVTYDHTISPIASPHVNYNLLRSQTKPFKVQIH